MNYYELLRQVEPGEFPVWVRRMPGKVRDLYWTPFTVVCAACQRRHSCKCPSMSRRESIRSRVDEELKQSSLSSFGGVY